MQKINLAIVCTHPIQYYAPVFRALSKSQRITPRVFYTWSQSESGQYFDSEFGINVEWDVPLLTGYDYQFVENTAKKPSNKSFFGIDNPTLNKEIQNWGADAILVYGWNKKSHFKAMRFFKKKIPVFFRGDSNLIDSHTSVRTAIRRVILSFIYRYIDKAISVGLNNKDYYKWCGIPEERIGFAPHCINNSHFEDPKLTHQQQAKQWRHQLGIEDHEIVVVYAGKLIPKKAPLLLLKAFEQTNTTAHLIFFGNGELESELRQAAENNNRIHFMPFQNQSQMPAVYRTGEMFVLPSCGPGETWGLAMNEAMACSRAVIASSKVGGARDLIINGQSGWIFESGNIDQLTTILAQAIDKGQSGLNEIGNQAHKIVNKWSTEESASQTEDSIIEYFNVR